MVKSNKLKRLDIFGPSIPIYLDGELNHATVFGGLVSVFIKLFMLMILGIEIKKWYLFDADNNNSVPNFVGMEEIEEVSFDKTDFFPVIGFWEAGTRKPIKYDDDMQKYINLTLSTISYDALADPVIWPPITNYFDFKPCFASDFKNEKHQKIIS